MTGYTVHTGASKKFVSGWDKVFGSAPAEKTGGKSAAKGSSVKKSSGAKAKKGKKK
jgi:hypothetical protein